MNAAKGSSPPARLLRIRRARVRDVDVHLLQRCCNGLKRLSFYREGRWYRPGAPGGPLAVPEWFREAVLNSKDYNDGTIEVALNDEANAGDQIFPKVKFHWTKDPTWVRSAAEEAALGGGWADKPAAFDPYKGPRSDRTEGQDPAKWLDQWSVPGLKEGHES